MEHLTELRKRIVLSFWGVLIGFFITYYFSDTIFAWLMTPLCDALSRDHCPMIFTGLAEPFMVYLKVGLIGGIFLASPWIFFQLWSFIAPGLHRHEKKWVVPFISLATIMFVGGALLTYFYIFPFAFQFFLSQASAPIMPMLSMQDYFSFSAGLLLAFGMLFELPILIILLNTIGVVKAKTLWGTWRYGIVGIYILAAILTPADPYTMLLLGTPLSILYLASLGVCSLIENSRSKGSKEVGH